MASIRSRPSSAAYAEGWDRIFGGKKAIRRVYDAYREGMGQLQRLKADPPEEGVAHWTPTTFDVKHRK